MNNKIYSRILKEFEYISKENLTIRQIAHKIHVSKSTVHKDLHERLYHINKELYNEVDKILKKHIQIRHINGGKATKLKYQKIRKG